MRLAVGVLVMSGMVIGITADAYAHGGSHATPWPTPTTSTYSYQPTTYFPTYYPTPPPSGGTPTTPVTPGTPGNPTTPGAPTTGTPTNPGTPTGPGTPNTNPGTPTGPGGPNTGTPTGPGGPSTGPGGPSTPVTGPSVPTTPGGPTGTPGTPTAPGAPTPPTGGGTPTAPSNPGGGPGGPSTGTTPGAPGAPGSPTSPGGTPTTPVNPTNPTPPTGNPGTPGTPGTPVPPTGYGPVTGAPTGKPGAPASGGNGTGPKAPTAPGSRPNRGRTTAAPTAGQRAKSQLEAKQQWTAWWHLNQWRFLRGQSNRATVTGSDAVAGNKELAEFLMNKALKDRHFDPKSAACIALGKMGETGARKQLERLVLDRKEKNYVRESAALALGMMGAQPSAGLLDRIARDARNDEALRVNAVIGMGLLRDPSHVNSLLQLVTRRDDRQVHTAAAIALGLIGDQTAVNALHKIAGAYSMDPSVRSAAINALGKTAPGTKHEAKVFKTLRRLIQSDKKDDVRRAAALVLYRFKDKELLGSLDRVIRNDRDDVTAGFAMISLAEAVHARGDARDRRAARGLFQARLAGGKSTVQGYAAVALGLLGRSDAECAAVLRPALTKESDNGVRAAVAIGLGLCEDIASRDALGRLAMGRGAQQDLRGYACVALGMLAAKSQDAGISKYLTEIVDNVNIPEVKAAAALALSKIGSSPEALTTLRKALKDRNRYFKMSAIVALGYFRDHGTVKDFTELYKRESNYEVRALSVVALGYIGEDAPVPVLRQISMDFNHLSVFQKQMDAMNIILGLF